MSEHFVFFESRPPAFAHGNTFVQLYYLLLFAMFYKSLRTLSINCRWPTSQGKPVQLRRLAATPRPPAAGAKAVPRHRHLIGLRRAPQPKPLPAKTQSFLFPVLRPPSRLRTVSSCQGGGLTSCSEPPPTTEALSSSALGTSRGGAAW